jgi:hypothetical protein
MPSKHLFTLLVLTGAAAVVGLVALTSTVDLGQTAKASSTSDPAIGYRLQQLDGLESDLRRQLAESAPAAAPAETVYRRAAAPPAAAADSDSDSEDDQNERASEDQREYDHEDQGDDRDEHKDEDERDD